MIAAIYARKSSEQLVADEQKSVARQVDNARAFAAARGWTVDDRFVFVDDGVSGAETARLRERQRMIATITEGRCPFDVVVMQAQDRFSRRDGDEAFGELKRLAEHVDIWFYADARQFRFGTFEANVTGMLHGELAAEFRRIVSAKTKEAHVRLARAGHVTGGVTFGYDNVEKKDAGGRRSHVERRINDAEAAIVRRVFQLCADGLGVKAIAKRLNMEGAPSPVPRRKGRSASEPPISPSWAPSSVRDVLHRDLYRGLITWNRTRKRNQRGEKHQAPRPASDWIDVPAPHLAIVTADAWRAAHARLDAARDIYGRGKGGGRPPLGSQSKYLLTALALCGCCGETMRVRSRKSHANDTKRRFFYGCAGYHDRGTCANGADAPMADTDLVLIEALLDDVLDPSILRDSIEFAIGVLRGDGAAERRDDIEKDLGQVERERRQLLAAIASGRQVTGLLEALQALGERQAQLEAQRAAIASQRRLRAADAANLRRELTTLSNGWRHVLAEDPTNARPIVTMLLNGRVTITPATSSESRTKLKEWDLSGNGTLDGLFSRSIFPSGWRPHREAVPTEIPFFRHFRAA